MITGQKGIDLIKHFEGEKLKAYLCPANVPTIGVGSTYYEDGSKVKIGDIITAERSTNLLKNTVRIFELIVNRNLTRTVTQNQFDALVSFCFNCGSSETLFKLVNENSPLLGEWWKNHYITGGGVKLKGLIIRRAAEYELYTR